VAAKDAGKPTLIEVGDQTGKSKVAMNMMSTLLAGFLVFFMQAGFALVETGFTRAKNVAHTMMMNFMIYCVGMTGYWIMGYALQMGGVGALGTMGGTNVLDTEFTISLFGRDFGLFGMKGFFLAGTSYDVAVFALFLFQLVFMDTAATIPTGAMAERWKFSSFMVYGFFISMISYPLFANWVWGGGWLSQLGKNFGLGHGHVDFAGSSVVHMMGGVTALAGAMVLGPRIGKYNKDGSANPIPGHNLPMGILGCFILAFGWFGFNPGSTLAASDMRIAVIAVNTLLASGAGALAAMFYMWIRFGKPDPTMAANGFLGGLVAITAPCAFVSSFWAFVIGGIAGVILCWSVFFIENTLRVDDPVGASSVHGTCGAWGVTASGSSPTGPTATASTGSTGRCGDCSTAAVASSWPRSSGR
jgi:Amt family ammonium transporter